MMSHQLQHCLSNVRSSFPLKRLSTTCQTESEISEDKYQTFIVETRNTYKIRLLYSQHTQNKVPCLFLKNAKCGTFYDMPKGKVPIRGWLYSKNLLVPKVFCKSCWSKMFCQIFSGKKNRLNVTRTVMSC